ncbi:helix-turn-helix transcriptional regulator [Proteiniphilum sp.]|uniref:helix-turn-helix domain-containing protein n=1 Tax=Proteiniphilum sp. TaxID=1926877 RepID=UPI0033196D71
MLLRIKEIAKRRSVTGVALAEMIGITQQNMSNIMNGKINPSLDTLQKIADALGVTVPELFAPQNTTDFTAFIDYKGELKRFDSPEELKRFLEKV